LVIRWVVMSLWLSPNCILKMAWFCWIQRQEQRRTKSESRSRDLAVKQSL
jgi:hypothetical protein